MFDSVIFDLDGTLWDAVPEIVQSWNEGMKKKGVHRAPLTIEEVRPCMGMEPNAIAARLFSGISPEEQLEILECCSIEECAYLAAHGSALFPGTAETLKTLGQRYALYLVSNCQDGYIQAFFQGTGMGTYFSGFECAGRTGMSKGKNIQLVMQREHLHSPVYVGDTILDYRASQEAGIPFVFAAYGFGDVAGTPSVSSIRELPDRLSQMEKGES